MSLKVKPEFINLDNVKNARRKIEIDVSCIDWKKVVQAAHAENKRIEEILGIPILKPYSKPDGIDERYEEMLQEESERTSKTRHEIIDEARKRPSAFEAAERRAQRLGATMDELFIIDRISITHSSVDEEDISHLKGL